MTFGIVIPLKSQIVSRNWAVTCTALAQTLRSVESQTSPDWCAVVVGHEEPELFRTAAGLKTEFHQIETSPPVRPPNAHRQFDYASQNPLTLDKNRKIVRGMQLLNDRGINYWFALDADDLLHRDFVQTLSAMELKSGAILDGGYIIYTMKRRIVPYSDMSAICGSTSILRAADFQIPNSLDVDQIQKVPWSCYSHTDMDLYFERQCNAEYVRVKDRLIAYNMGHGDNWSDIYRDTFTSRLKAWAKPYILGTRFSNEHRRDFSIARDGSQN